MLIVRHALGFLLTHEAKHIPSNTAHLNFFGALGDSIATMMPIYMFKRLMPRITQTTVGLHRPIGSVAAQSVSNRQGRGDVIEGEQAKEVLELLKNDAERTYDNYETMLNERFDGSTIDENKKGLARELARMNLTLNTYTQWYWKTDLLNLMNFLRLRADSHAQYEIRVYADIMLDTVKKWVPITYDAFMDYRVGGTEVSAKGKVIIQKLIKGEDVSPESSGLSKREWNELMVAFDLKDKLI